MHAAKELGQQPYGRSENRGERDAQVNTVDQGTMTVLALTGAESLRHESVESHKQSSAEERQDNEDVGAEAYRAHGGGAIGKMADHHGVHDGHTHPAEFGEHQRQGEVHRGREFFAKSFQADHGTGVR